MLQQIIDHKEPSTIIRIFQSDKERLDQLQRRLTVEAGGQPVSQAQVIRYLLDLQEGQDGHNQQPA